MSDNGREQMREFTLEAQRSRMLETIQTEVLGEQVIHKFRGANRLAPRC